jgi:hypothetical protein
MTSGWRKDLYLPGFVIGIGKWNGATKAWDRRSTACYLYEKLPGSIDARKGCWRETSELFIMQ